MMNEKEEVIVNRYLRKENLTELETSQIEEILSNPEFANQIQEMKYILLHIENEETKQLMSILNKTETKLKAKNYSLFRILAILAVIGLLIFTVFYNFNINKDIKQDSTDELFAQYFKPYPNIIDPISKGGGDISIFQVYEKEQYEEVIGQLKVKQVLSEDEKFYFALSYMSVGEFDNAEQQFSSVDDTKYDYAVLWYKALICLSKEGSLCKALFTEIQNSENQYSELSAKLLNEF